MKTQLPVSYQEIIGLENLFAAWQEFLSGKKNKTDVREFGTRLADNILQLHEDLANFSYIHGPYKAFNVSDPKSRNIHKASVRDRVLHHAIYRQLYSFFDKIFIADSYSCRIGKGTHKALNRFREFGRIAGKNHTKTVWVLKCDIKKFFASIDHKILLEVLAARIPDKDVLWLLRQVVGSFDAGPHCFFVIPRIASDEESLKFDNQLALRDPSARPWMHSGSVGMAKSLGLPLGNLTSQLLCNVYMNEFDQFAKHKLKAKYYIRYADDFVFLSADKNQLRDFLPRIAEFLERQLGLKLHPNKVFIKTLASGVDFLGWVNFPHHQVLRKSTGRRMFKRVLHNPKNASLQSYLGLISHGNGHKLKEKLLNWYGLLEQQA